MLTSESGKMDRFSGCGILWCCLKFLGIDILKSRDEDKIQVQNSAVKKFANKVAKFLYPLILHVMQVYALVSWTILYSHGAATIEVLISFCVSNLFSMALWQDVNSKKNIVRSLVTKCHHLAYLLDVRRKQNNTVVNLSLFLSICTLVVLTAFYGFVISESSPEYIMYYSVFKTFGNHNIVSILVRSVMILITFSILYLVPSLVAIFVCAMYCKVSSLFRGMYENVKNVLKFAPQYKQVFEVMQKYNHLYQLAHQTERAFSLTALLLLCSQCLSVYLVLVTFFKVENESFSYALYWESIVRLIMGPLSITAVVLCGSSIASQVRKIQTCLQMIHSSLLYDADKNHKTLQLVSSMLNMEFPQMTAYGVLELKPSLILTSLGSVLTYGLLVLNIKKT
ncbi:hypothetical protein AVEN_267472-1 [Araneus ventricosus]|uniref:Gustatory receptor n=1 Tax=Araneus ventricosus TaxID=182803 RepID=A0A4Y2TPQ2_ARAVE|nr:hypothetical protein AVEN_267472-1 [Araneus ventricosus]